MEKLHSYTFFLETPFHDRIIFTLEKRWKMCVKKQFFTVGVLREKMCNRVTNSRLKFEALIP